MSSGLLLRLACAVCLSTIDGAAAAQSKNLEVPPDESSENPAPPPRRGVQLAARTGVAIPIAFERNMSGDMSSALGVQVPLVVDAGWKPHERVLVGAYLGGSLGDGGRSLGCSEHSCFGGSVRLGPQVHYQFRPGGRFNPWVGLGAGIHWSSITATPPGGGEGFWQDTEGRRVAGPGKTTVNLFGWDFARVMFGVDTRVSELFGVGPFVEGSLGQHTSIVWESGPYSSSGPLKNQGLEGSVAIGVRAVLLP